MTTSVERAGTRLLPAAATPLAEAAVDTGVARRPPLPRLFARQVKLTPDAVAATCGASSLSYQRLDQLSDNAATYLAGRGIGPDHHVGVALPRSLDMLVWLLGILKSGAAYVPLDLSYPAERLRHMMNDADVSVVVVAANHQTRLPDGVPRLVVDAPPIGDAIRQPLPAPGGLPLKSADDAVAYVIYTSGSTGLPKGVAISTQALATFTHAALERLRFAPGERCLGLTTIGFDISILELLVPLCAGATVVIADDGDARDPGRVAELIRRTQPATVQATPSMWGAVLQHDAGCIDGLQILVGGEALSRDLATALRSRSRAVINLYGPTEATVWASAHDVCDSDLSPEAPATVAIGRPLAGYDMYLVDQSLNPVPDGGDGELCIGGSALALGYWRDPARTSERFVSDPRGSNGDRIYLTGDIARRTPGGVFHFRGRSDRQVKIRGFRVELGEIESALRRNPAVQEAVVTADASGQRLLAYVVCRDGGDVRARTVCLDAWRDVWNATYQDATGGELDLAGWKSSVSGEALPADEMRSWVEQTVGRIRALQPRRVLEIGCGTGLLLTRLAPHCESYIGIDVSNTVLATLARYVGTRPDLRSVHLRQAAAHELEWIGDASVDLVILNSVVQYFPDVEYLIGVLRSVARVLGPDGTVFVGDVRNLRWLEGFHALRALDGAESGMFLAELKNRMTRAQRTEKELVLDPELFDLIAADLGYRTVYTWIKGGTFDNELSRFRYDVVLRARGEPHAIVTPDHSLAWDDERGSWREAVVAICAGTPGAAVAVAGVPNPNAVQGVKVRRYLDRVDAPTRTLADMRTDVGDTTRGAMGEVLTLAERLGVAWTCRRFDDAGTFEVVFSPRWAPVGRLATQAVSDASRCRALANNPAQNAGNSVLQRRIHADLQRILPEYMVPAAVVLMEALPRLPNGKLDRAALSSPELAGAGVYRAPRTSDEATLCRLFGEVLGVDAVGIDDNFFELGGQSLMAARLATRVQAELNASLTLHALFEAPTVAALSDRLRTDALVRGSRRVVALRAEGSRIPLFCLPPVYGLGFAYAGLARELEAGRPIYCLQASIEQDDRFPASVHAAAAEYVAIIRSVRPKGRYHLLGWSFGGILAHAVACHLQQDGDAIASLTIIDAYPKVAERVARVGGQPIPYLDTIREHLEDALGTVDRTYVNGLLRLSINNALVMAEFAPRRFDGGALLIAARENGQRSPLWTPYIGGRLDVHTLPCRHMDLMTLQFASEVGGFVEQHLKTAEV